MSNNAFRELIVQKIRDKFPFVYNHARLNRNMSVDDINNQANY